MNKKEIIFQILKECPETRSNDNELIYQYLKRTGMPTDYEQLRALNFNLAESVRRARQKIQQTNPLLAPTESTRRHRQSNEQKIREMMRKEI